MNGSTHSRTNSWREKNGSESGAEQSRAQWSTQSFTAEDIVQQFALPQIVKCNQQAILVKREVPLPINLAQPILLHDKRTIRKLLARNVVLDPTTHRYSENDETVVIPADYDGKSVFKNAAIVKHSNIIFGFIAENRMKSTQNILHVFRTIIC